MDWAEAIERRNEDHLSYFKYFLGILSVVTSSKNISTKHGKILIKCQ